MKIVGWDELDSYDKADKLLEICEGLMSHAVIPNIQKLALGNKLTEESTAELKQSLEYIKECKVLCESVKVNYDPDLCAIKEKAKIRINDLENLLLAFGV